MEIFMPGTRYFWQYPCVQARIHTRFSWILYVSFPNVIRYIKTIVTRSILIVYCLLITFLIQYTYCLLILSCVRYLHLYNRYIFVYNIGTKHNTRCWFFVLTINNHNSISVIKWHWTAAPPHQRIESKQEMASQKILRAEMKSNPRPSAEGCSCAFRIVRLTFRLSVV